MWFLFPLAAAAAEIPEAIFLAGVGVNIHFVIGHEAELDMIATGGFSNTYVETKLHTRDSRRPPSSLLGSA